MSKSKWPVESPWLRAPGDDCRGTFLDLEVGGLLLLLLRPTFTVPRVIVTAATTVASASLVIYLTDFGVLPLGSYGFPPVAVVAVAREAHFPAAARDVKAAVRYLRAHASGYGIDADRFALWGESAGANLAAVVGVTTTQRTIMNDPGLGNGATSASVQAVVDWYGPVDFAQWVSQYRVAGSDGSEGRQGRRG